MKQNLVVLLSVVTLVAGCSGAGSGTTARTVEVETGNMAFMTREITLEKGQSVRMVLHNKDSMLHDLVIDRIPMKNMKTHGDHHEMKGKKADLHMDAEAGKKAEIEFTPTEVGTYSFYCSVPGHKDAGMVGQMVVK